MAETKKVSLKLLVDIKGHKVLFAEAGKEFVDFLFHIFSLPIGTVVNLLSEEGVKVGSLGDLHKSLEAMNGEYLLENSVKNSVLKPITPVGVPLLSLRGPPTTGPLKKIYGCSHCGRSTVTDSYGTKCSCGNSMTREMSYMAPGNITTSSNGFVKEAVTYMVMDNLVVKPTSTISSITQLNKFHIKDVSSLVEKEVQVGISEGLAMLKASLETQDVLTTVFLGMKPQCA